MPTVSKSSIEAKIRGVYFINAGEAIKTSNGGYTDRDLAELNLVTICIIILENGFKVEGTSACVDLGGCNIIKKRKEAYDAAFEKIWEKEGYLLKQKMFEENQK